MKYLRKFDSSAARQAYLDTAIVPDLPFVHYIQSTNEVFYSNDEPEFKMHFIPLHINALSDLTIQFSNTYEYSMDNKNWVSATASTSISASAGETVYFRAAGLTPVVNDGIGTFSINNGTCNVCGNVMSMLYGEGFVGKTEILDNSFTRLFKDADSILDASLLVLPAISLARNCYSNMFDGCASMVNTPRLPATILGYGCYLSMFYNCTSLIEAPELPATTLANYCYRSMFMNCASLINAPKLPATNLTWECYNLMFSGCTSLVTAPELPATEMNEDCYCQMFMGCTSLVNAPELPATTLAVQCYGQMFQGCTSLVDTPELPATTLDEWCYTNMFNGCTSLINAPELPATTLANYCYYHMFSGCTQLNHIKMLATDISASGCLTSWVKNVSSTGTFVKNADATWDVTGVNGIPEGWTVETATA